MQAGGPRHLPSRGPACCSSQPLPSDEDGALDEYRSLPLCADESFSDSLSFGQRHPRYGCINIRLDRTGGLTDALRCAEIGRARGLELFAGNMLGTSLVMPERKTIERARKR